MLTAAVVAGMLLASPPLCSTYEVCDMDATCTCTVPARSAGGLFFYWDIAVYRGTNITCTLESSPTRYAWQHAGSALPAGIEAACAGSCETYPLRIVFNTQNAAEAQGLMRLKYYVPPSDMPSRSSLACTPSP